MEKQQTVSYLGSVQGYDSSQSGMYSNWMLAATFPMHCSNYRIFLVWELIMKGCLFAFRCFGSKFLTYHNVSLLCMNIQFKCQAALRAVI